MYSVLNSPPSLNRFVIRDNLRARRLTVSQSLSGGSVPASLSPLLCAIAPSHVPKRLMSFLLPPLQLFPGGSPTPTQIMPICIAKTDNDCNVFSLSPL